MTQRINTDNDTDYAEKTDKLPRRHRRLSAAGVFMFMRLDDHVVRMPGF